MHGSDIWDLDGSASCHRLTLNMLCFAQLRDALCQPRCLRNQAHEQTEWSIKLAMEAVEPTKF